MSTGFIDLNIDVAEQFIESVSEPNSDNVYFTFGKVTSWANDASPPEANTSYDTVYEIWRNMRGAKRISGNDIRLVTRRNNWEANTIYSQYDNANPDMFDANNVFFIVTDEFNVYKCLSNNSGAFSQVKPTAINANNVTQTADGYVWKYMYTIDTSERLRYMTDAFIPVKTLTLDNGSLQWQVQQAAVEGAIYGLKISNPGSNYSNTSNLIVTISGDGQGATANATVNSISGTINSVSVINYGQGYSHAEVSVSGGGGFGAEIAALLSPGRGHGNDPVYELGAAYALINMRLNSSENDVFSVENEIRQVALVKNPLEYQTSNVASDLVISQSLDLTMAGSGVDYEEDEIVYQGPSISTATFIAKVMEYNSANSLLKVVEFSGTPTNDTLIGSNTTASKFVSSIANPGLDPFSGRLLYVNNIQPIHRDIDQVEDFKIVLSFIS